MRNLVLFGVSGVGEGVELDVSGLRVDVKKVEEV
jgi:hypothetical protein